MVAEKRAIVKLLDDVVHQQQLDNGTMSSESNRSYSDDDDDDDWMIQCTNEEQRRDRLLVDIIDERCRCARLRAELELFAVQNRRDAIVMSTSSAYVTRF